MPTCWEMVQRWWPLKWWSLLDPLTTCWTGVMAAGRPSGGGRWDFQFTQKKVKIFAFVKVLIFRKVLMSLWLRQRDPAQMEVPDRFFTFINTSSAGQINRVDVMCLLTAPRKQCWRKRSRLSVLDWHELFSDEYNLIEWIINFFYLYLIPYFLIFVVVGRGSLVSLFFWTNGNCVQIDVIYRYNIIGPLVWRALSSSPEPRMLNLCVYVEMML